MFTGPLGARMGPSFTGDLRHWHYDTFRVTWRDPSLGRIYLTFRLNPRGEPENLDLGLDGDPTYQRATN